MAAFYRGAVGDWFRDVAVSMVTDAKPQNRVDEEPEPPTHRDAIENPAHADLALSHRMAMVPCGNCGCPGCYDCTPDVDEPCTCLPNAGRAVPA